MRGARPANATSTCCSSAATRRGGAVAGDARPRCCWDRTCRAAPVPLRRPVDRRRPAWCSAPTSTRCSLAAEMLLNVHRDDRRPGYFEWARMVEAMANGCVVLTEPSTGSSRSSPATTSSRPTTWPTRSPSCSTTRRACRRSATPRADAVLDEHPLVGLGRDRSSSDSTTSTSPRRAGQRRAPAQPDRREPAARCSPSSARRRRSARAFQGADRRAAAAAATIESARCQRRATGGRPRRRALDTGLRPTARRPEVSVDRHAVQLRRRRHRDARLDRRVDAASTSRSSSSTTTPPTTARASCGASWTPTRRADAAAGSGTPTAGSPRARNIAFAARPRRPR